MIIFLLIVIAIGVLLASESGNRLLAWSVVLIASFGIWFTRACTIVFPFLILFVSVFLLIMPGGDVEIQPYTNFIGLVGLIYSIYHFGSKVHLHKKRY